MKRINPYKLFVGVFIPYWLFVRPEISHGAKLCYARLSFYAGRRGFARCSQPALADELCVSVRHARRYLTELETHKLIETHVETFQGHNTYYFLWHDWMEDAELSGPCPRTDRSVPSTPKRTDPSHLEETEETELPDNSTKEDANVPSGHGDSQIGQICPPRPDKNVLPDRTDLSSKKKYRKEALKRRKTKPSLRSGLRARESSARDQKATKPTTAPPLKTPPPESLTPTATQEAFANEHGISLAVEIPHCLSHHRAKGSRMASWPDALWTWLHNAAKGTYGNGHKPQAYVPSTWGEEDDPPEREEWHPTEEEKERMRASWR